MYRKIAYIVIFLFASCNSDKEIVSCYDTVVVYYKITTLDGNRIDASGLLTPFIESNRPFSFVACNKEIIPGWDRQVIGNKIGEYYKIHIKSEEAYGSEPLDRDLKANSDLIITYEILEIR